MAAGSARVLADLMSGQTPQIRADDLAVSRYRRTRRAAQGLARPAAA